MVCGKKFFSKLYRLNTVAEKLCNLVYSLFDILTRDPEGTGLLGRVSNWLDKLSNLSRQLSDLLKAVSDLLGRSPVMCYERFAKGVVCTLFIVWVFWGF